MKARYVMSLIGVAVIAFLPNSGWSQVTTNQSSKQAAPYTDPKNFFKISPPAGWRMQDYPLDPTKGSVVDY
jgi:hypothetical protein